MTPVKYNIAAKQGKRATCSLASFIIEPGIKYNFK
jgi:hypothetical protein